MTDPKAVLDAIVAVLKEINLPRGLLYIPLFDRVQARTGASKDEIAEAIMAGMDDCVLAEHEMGWVKIEENPEAARKAQDAALDRHMDAKADRDRDDERRHDAGRQHEAEGR